MDQEIKFWDVYDMYKYSLQTYPLPDGIKNDPATLSYYEETTKKAIQRKIKELGFPQLQADTGRKKYQLPYDYARFFIEHTMYEYFTKDKEGMSEKYKQYQEKQRKKVLNDMEKKSAPKDTQLEIHTGATNIVNTLLDPKNNPDDVLREKIASSKWYEDTFHVLSNNESVKKELFEYHIPPTTLDELNSNPEIVDNIIDRIMLRALFDMFFDFDEVSFRQDVYERAAHIKESNEDGVKPIEGYSELTRRIEDSLKTYIKKKEK